VTQFKRLLAAAVFGAFDGATSLVGVLLTLTGHPGQVMAAAVGLAVASGIGMAAGSWLSADEGGALEATVIGLATAAGTLLPALPYLALRGGPAMLASVLVLLALGAVITAVRARTEPLWRAAAKTYGVLIVTCVAVAVIVLALPGSAG
jgi:hypothetical protein